MADKHRVRIRFSKNGMMRFVGHLDMMRYFQKAIRRADIPIAYSNGFHPHQIMSFALPLGMGISSSGEYMDIELVEHMACDILRDRLDRCMAKGVEILSAVSVDPKAGKSMAAVAAAEYVVTVLPLGEDPFDTGRFKDGIRLFFTERDEIIVTKKTKKSEKSIDLKKLIYKLCISDNELSMILSAGSENNIKPELVMDNLFGFMELNSKDFKLCIHRNDLMQRKEDGSFCSMSEGSC